MPADGRLDGCIDEMGSEFVDREATQRLLMKPGLVRRITNILYYLKD